MGEEFGENPMIHEELTKFSIPTFVFIQFRQFSDVDISRGTITVDLEIELYIPQPGLPRQIKSSMLDSGLTVVFNGEEQLFNTKPNNYPEVPSVDEANMDIPLPFFCWSQTIKVTTPFQTDDGKINDAIMHCPFDEHRMDFNFLIKDFETRNFACKFNVHYSPAYTLRVSNLLLADFCSEFDLDFERKHMEVALLKDSNSLDEAMFPDEEEQKTKTLGYCQCVLKQCFDGAGNNMKSSDATKRFELKAKEQRSIGTNRTEAYSGLKISMVIIRDPRLLSLVVTPICYFSFSLFCLLSKGSGSHRLSSLSWCC